MAGITAMGDLSHELETLLIGLDDGRVKPTPAIDELLQHSIDELHRMRDAVIANKPVAAASDLEVRIKQANAGFDVAEETAVIMPTIDTGIEVAKPAEFTVEPEDSVSMVIVHSPLEDESEHEPELVGGPS